MQTDQRVKKLLVMCSECGHDEYAHTWINTFSGTKSMGNCSAITDTFVVTGKHIEKTCKCRLFTSYSPLEMCEILETNVDLDTLTNL